MENIQELNNLFISFCQCLVENCEIRKSLQDNKNEHYFNINEQNNIIWIKKVNY